MSAHQSSRFVEGVLRLHRRWGGSGRRVFIAIALVVAALCFRVAVVTTWHVPAGDGLQYYALSQQLSLSQRYAFGPAPAPLTYARLPGFPMWLAAVVHDAPLSLAEHLRRATVWNCLLDLGTAALLMALARRRGLGQGVGWLAGTLVVVFPPILFLSCFGLSESLTTFLATLELYLVVRAMHGQTLPFAIATGVVAGIMQLVRADAVSHLPAVVLALLWSAQPWRRRVAAVAACGLAAMLAFAPWPLRNQLHFGSPHPLGAGFVSKDGTPLPPGFMAWMRSYADGRPGQSYLIMLAANRGPADPFRPGILLPEMYDDEPEKARVHQLLVSYNQHYLSPQVDAELLAMAAARSQRNPLRHYVWLPLRRALLTWMPSYPWELPMRSRLLGLPALRPAWDWAGNIVLLIGVAGIAVTWRRDRRLVILIVLTVLSRSFLIGWVHPCPTQRYLVEALPGMLLLAAVALAQGAARLGLLRGGDTPTPLRDDPPSRDS